MCAVLLPYLVVSYVVFVFEKTLYAEAVSTKFKLVREVYFVPREMREYRGNCKKKGDLRLACATEFS